MDMRSPPIFPLNSHGKRHRHTGNHHLPPRHRVRATLLGSTLLLHRIGADGVRHRDARPDDLRPRGASRRVCRRKEGMRADPSLLRGVDQMHRPLLHRHGLLEFERRLSPCPAEEFLLSFTGDDLIDDQADLIRDPLTDQDVV